MDEKASALLTVVKDKLSGVLNNFIGAPVNKETEDRMVEEVVKMMDGLFEKHNIATFIMEDGTKQDMEIETSVYCEPDGDAMYGRISFHPVKEITFSIAPQEHATPPRKIIHVGEVDLL